MRLVAPPLHREGPEGPSKQGAEVAPSARQPEHYGLVAAGPLPPISSLPPMHEHPVGKATGEVTRSRGSREWLDMQDNQLL